MIVLSFNPGALGFMIVRTIHAHWPEHFGKNYGVNFKNRYDNHQVQPDLFLNNHTRIFDEQIQLLESLMQRPSLVLVHNINLVPDHIVNNSWVASIESTDEFATCALFLYWIKSGRSIIDFVKASSTNLYPGLFLQLARTISQQSSYTAPVNIKFQDLNKLESLVPILDQVQLQYNLQPYQLNHSWYNEVYSNSVQPLSEFSEIFTEFQNVCSLIKNNNAITWDNLSSSNQEKFINCVYFFQDQHSLQREPIRLMP